MNNRKTELASFDIVMFNMSEFSDWEKKNLVNRNRHILYSLLGNKNVGKILAIDFLPFSKKRAARLWLENIRNSKDIKGKIIFKTGLSCCYQAKHNTRLYILSTVKNIFSNRGLINDIKKALELLAIKNYILWSYDPLSINQQLLLQPMVRVFDAVDDWQSHPKYKKFREQIHNNYQTISKDFDLIFTVSKELSNHFKNSFWLANGVDTKHFRAVGLKDPLKNYQRPIVGYVGIIEKRFDMDLLHYLAEKNPNLSFVILGWLWKGVNKIKLPNVYFLGQVAYQDLPAYINSFTVGIIPHKINRFTKSMNPLKLYEYLALGKPVITTPVAGVEKYSNYIYISRNANDFNEKLRKSLAENNQRLATERIKLMELEDWKIKINKIMEILIDKIKTCNYQ